MSYIDAAIAIYRHHGAIIFAISKECASGEFGQVISFAPFNTHLRGGERAYLITSNSRVARRVGRFDFSPSNTTNSAFWNENEIDIHIQRNAADKGDLIASSSSGIGDSSLSSPIDSTLDICSLTVLQSKGSFKKSKKNSEEEEIAHTPSIKDPRPSNPVLGSTLPEYVDKHYLYCILGTTFPSNLIYFASPIRQKDKESPIVFLCQTAPAAEDWEVLSEFNKVFYIVGSPLLRRDLRKAKVMKALHTICFADPTQVNVADRAADSSTLLTLLNIQAISKNAESNNFVTVEFIHIQNMKLIGSYKHNIIEGAATEALQLDMQNIIPAFCGGHVFSSGMFHSILCQAFYEHNLIPVLRMFLFDGGSNDTTLSDDESVRSFFFQIELCGRFQGLSFGSLFTLLLKKYQVLALGLYRQAINDANFKKFQYVYLNPKAEALIQEGDLIFAIGSKKPTWD